MTNDFSVKFIIDRATPSVTIRLTDASTGVTSLAGNFKITFPDGTVKQNTDFTSADITAPLGNKSYGAENGSDGDVQRGTYTIVYTALDQDTDEILGVTKTFNFTFNEPEITITNTSDTAIPKVAFSCLTDFSQTDFTEVVSTFEMTSAFPSTSAQTGNSVTQDMTVSTELDQVASGSYFEGVYNPVVDYDGTFTNTTYSWLTVQFVDQKTTQFAIHKCPTAATIVQAIRDYRDTYPDLDERYQLICSLWTNIDNGVRQAYDDDNNSLVSELLTLLGLSYSNSYQSGAISGLGVFTSVSDLGDVNLTGLADGDFLQYSGSGTEWVNISSLPAAKLSGTIADARIASSSVTQHEGDIDHDALTNYNPDEHINWKNAVDNLVTTGLLVGYDIWVRGDGVSDAGAIRLYDADRSNFLTLKSKDSATGDYTIEFPDASGTLALSSDIPTNVSELTNDSGYITITELSEDTSPVLGGNLSGANTHSISAVTTISANTSISAPDVYTSAVGNATINANLRVEKAATGTGSIVFGTAGAVDFGRFSGTNGGFYMEGATGGSQGAGTINATGVYVNGVAVQQSTANVQTVSSSASITPTTSNDLVDVTALAVNTAINAPTGTPTEGQALLIRIEPTGAYTITWNAIYQAIGVTLPTTTTSGKKIYVACCYNSNDTKWDVIGVTEEA